MMDRRCDVLVLGGGLSGKLTAYFLVKRGLTVQIITPETLKESTHPVEASLKIDDKTGDFHPEPSLSKKALEHLIETYPSAANELLECQDLNLAEGATLHDLHASLNRFLRGHSLAQVRVRAFAAELMMLETSSSRLADRYRKPTCLGAFVADTDNGEFFPVTAKETVLATGGLGGLTRDRGSRALGSGFAMAKKAGARLFEMGTLQFNKACLKTPQGIGGDIPEALLDEGTLLNREMEVVSTPPTHEEVYYLKLTRESLSRLTTRYPNLIESLERQVGNLCENPIPLTSSPSFVAGGIMVEKTGQTTVTRLRAVGETASTGLQNDVASPRLTFQETVCWTRSTAEDIQKQIQKFAYYFPELKQRTFCSRKRDVIRADKRISELKQLFSLYLKKGASQDDLRHLTSRINSLFFEWEEHKWELAASPDAWAYIHALTASKAILESALRAKMEAGFQQETRSAVTQALSSVFATNS